MKRVLRNLIIIYLTALASISGCNSGGSGGDSPTPEPTPVPTLEPTPTPGRDCDFVPDESGQFYTEEDCIDLSDAFSCSDFSFQDGVCEVFGCEDCLCNAFAFVSIADDGVFSPEDCAISHLNRSCFNAFFVDGSPDECHLFVCVREAPCGPFDVIIP